jgi:hypothetical protein
VGSPHRERSDRVTARFAGSSSVVEQAFELIEEITLARKDLFACRS